MADLISQRAVSAQEGKTIKRLAEGKPFSQLCSVQGWVAQVFGAEMLMQNKLQQN